MTVITKKQAKLDPRVAGFMQYLSENGVDLGEAKGKAKIGEAKGKAKPAPSEDFVGQAELVKALKVHYADFEGSELAEASRRRTATPKRPKGRCGYYALVKTWAIQNSNQQALDWCEKMGSSKAIAKWYKKFK